MANALDDEDWKHVKIGRFSDVDERLIQRVMGSWFLKSRNRRSLPNRKPSFPGRKPKEHQIHVLATRGNTVSHGYDCQSRKQAVVKVGFCPKSRRGVMNLVRYVARLRAKDQNAGAGQALPLWDGYGDKVDEAFAVKLPNNWDLASDQENYSKRARECLRAGNISAFKQMGARERFRNIQAWHFTLSIEEGEAELSDRMHAAVRATVDTVFIAEGHSVLWTIHAGHSDHLHAHLVVKAQSEFGGRLHSDIHGDYLQFVRETFAVYLQRAGLDYEATRRIDREPVRDEILSGHAPLKEERLPWRKADSSRDSYEHFTSWAVVFGDRALQSVKCLENVRRHVQEATQGLSGAEKGAMAAHLLREHLNHQASSSRWRELFRPKRKGGEQRKGLTESEKLLLRHFEKGFHNPCQALESWRLMASDGAYRLHNEVVYPNYDLAVWTLCHRPEFFGMVKADAYGLELSKRLAELLRKARLWPPARLPQGMGKRISFFEHRRRTRAMRGQVAVISGLAKLQHRIDEVWPGSYRVRKVGQAIQRAKRAKLDDQAFIYMLRAANDEPTRGHKVLKHKRMRHKPNASSEGPLKRIPEKSQQRRHVPSRKSQGIER